MKRPCPIGKKEKECGIATDCLSCDYYFGIQVEKTPELNDLNLRIILQALKIWRGDFPITDEYPNNKPAYPTVIWKKEVQDAIEKIERMIKK